MSTPLRPRLRTRHVGQATDAPPRLSRAPETALARTLQKTPAATCSWS